MVFAGAHVLCHPAYYPILGAPVVLLYVRMAETYAVLRDRVVKTSANVDIYKKEYARSISSCIQSLRIAIQSFVVLDTELAAARVVMSAIDVPVFLLADLLWSSCNPHVARFCAG